MPLKHYSIQNSTTSTTSVPTAVAPPVSPAPRPTRTPAPSSLVPGPAPSLAEHHTSGRPHDGILRLYSSRADMEAPATAKFALHTVIAARFTHGACCETIVSFTSVLIFFPTGWRCLRCLPPCRIYFEAGAPFAFKTGFTHGACRETIVPFTLVSCASGSDMLIWRASCGLSPGRRAPHSLPPLCPFLPRHPLSTVLRCGPLACASANTGKSSESAVRVYFLCPTAFILRFKPTQ